MLPQLTTTQVILRLNQRDESGMVDLSNHDLRFVDVYDPDLRNKITELTDTTGSPDTSSLLFVDLSGSDISGLDFGGFDLSRVILSNVIAERTIFKGAVLNDTALDNANVDFADFRRAILTYTKLYDTSIVGANFAGADLSLTRGIGFNDPGEHTIKRLGQAGNITDTILPAEVEKMRNDIQEEISRNKKIRREKYEEHLKNMSEDHDIAKDEALNIYLGIDNENHDENKKVGSKIKDKLHGLTHKKKGQPPQPDDE